MENLTLILTIVQGAVFLSYVLYLTYRFGVLPSISESHYRLSEIRKGYLFTLFCWVLSITMIFQTNETSPLFFLSATGLAFVGAASMFKWDGAQTAFVHYIGASLGIAGALIGLMYEYSNPHPVAIFILSTLILKLFSIRNAIWWVEIIAFLCIISGLLYRFV